jgi:hypothetical protein
MLLNHFLARSRFLFSIVVSVSPTDGLTDSWGDLRQLQLEARKRQLTSRVKSDLLLGTVLRPPSRGWAPAHEFSLPYGTGPNVLHVREIEKAVPVQCKTPRSQPVIPIVVGGCENI